MKLATIHERFAKGISLQDEFSNYEVDDYLSELERMAVEQYSLDDEIDSSIHDYFPRRLGDYGIEEEYFFENYRYALR